jgi:hypothetical protein
LYYVEFIRKKPDVTWEDFNRVVRRAYKHWAELHPEDSPVLAVARTWRLGPVDASYMIIWNMPDFARLDHWTKVRREDPASEAAVMEGTLSVADIDAGIYDEIGMEML